jgi:hypothetical protein
MKKNKLYIFLAIVTAVFLFGTAAVCNQCGAPVEEKIDVGEEESIAKEEEGNKEEEISEGETAEEEDKEEEAEEEGEAPTIELEIYEGPLYSAADNICYYRIKAIVTGSPAPTVEFSKDDSNGVWGSKKSQVNLYGPGETYTLTATAINSEGSETAAIDISWGCDIPAEVVEADVTLAAEDSRSGYISGTTSGVYTNGTLVYVGDNSSDEPVKGYLSFNISDIGSLDNVTVKEAGIIIAGVGHIGDPWVAGDEMHIKVFYYGDSLDYPDDYAVGGSLVKTFNTSDTLGDLSFSNDSLKNELQDAINNGKSYFQLKIGLNGVSNNSYSDVYKFESTNTSIHIKYEFTE